MKPFTHSEEILGDYAGLDDAHAKRYDFLSWGTAGSLERNEKTWKKRNGQRQQRHRLKNAHFLTSYALRALSEHCSEPLP